MQVRIQVHRHPGNPKALQISIADEAGGYRLCGPKFDATSQLLASVTLDQRAADEIRSYLARAFPPDETAQIALLKKAARLIHDRRNMVSGSEEMGECDEVCKAAGLEVWKWGP